MEALYDTALATVKPIKLKKNGEAGHVACALETINGVIYTGVCIDVPCSIGICAEQAAIAEMLKHGETQIKQIIAVYEDGSVLPPCGRCRELISQLDVKNEDTIVYIVKDKVLKLKELLPLVDMVLVMSVEPGFGGQKFMPNSIDKVKELKELREVNNYSYLINIDGGINGETAKYISDYVDMAVSGSYVVNAADPVLNLNVLKNI